jgi:hypothetical protein
MCPPARCESQTGRTVFTYSTHELLQLREKACVGIPRRTRRFLFVHKLLQDCHRPHEKKTHAIPVRIANRKGKRPPRKERRQTLVRVPVSLSRRHSRRKIPSVVLSNVRSMTNKMDEVEALFQERRPDVAVFVETWLDERRLPTLQLTFLGMLLFVKIGILLEGVFYVMFLMSIMCVC